MHTNWLRGWEKDVLSLSQSCDLACQPDTLKEAVPLSTFPAWPNPTDDEESNWSKEWGWLEHKVGRKRNQEEEVVSHDPLNTYSWSVGSLLSIQSCVWQFGINSIFREKNFINLLFFRRIDVFGVHLNHSLFFQASWESKKKKVI